MSLPLGDWQFWTVTAFTLGAVWLLVKPSVSRGETPSGTCASCPKSLHAASAPKATSSGRDQLVTIGKLRD